MSYEKHIQKMGDCLQIRYTGELAAEDLPEQQNVFQNIANLCLQNNCTKALLDSRELLVDLKILNLFKLGTELAEVKKDEIRFAMLAADEQVPDDNFMENVAVNRGANMRIFTNEDQAIAWLSND